MAHFLKGIAVAGEYIETLKDKTFTIIKAPQYEKSADLDNPEKTKEKLKMIVRISDGAELNYYPNITSQKTMANLRGHDTDKWVSQRFEWEITQMKVRKDMKAVLYVKDKQPNGKA